MVYLFFVVFNLHLVWFVGKVVCVQCVREFRDIGVLILILKCSVLIFSFFHCQKKKQKRLGLAYSPTC